MSVQHYSIRMNGYLGDQLFQTSVARALKNKDPECKVEFTNVRQQLVDIFEKVSFIDSVTPYLESTWGHNDVMFNERSDNYYDITLPLYNNRSILPTLFYQQFAGIEYKFAERDFKLDIDLSSEKKLDNKFRIGVPLDWEAKSFDYTLEEYEIGEDVPTLGYGGKHRNINKMLRDLLNKLNDEVELVRLGLGYNHSLNALTKDEIAFERLSYMSTAKAVADCDLVIGSEGGITNLANALNVPTHTTTDFQMQLYGWNGVLEKTEMDGVRTGLSSPMGVKLGPFQFDQSGIHTYSIHYASDEEVCEDIVNIVKNMVEY